VTLRENWELRNAAAETLIKVELQLREALAAASTDDLVLLLESFSPARSPGPDWTRSFDALVEHLWLWCDVAVVSKLEANFRARGPAWGGVANALVPENGARIRQRLQTQTVPARLPPLTLG
jgi:hypothetical protein